VTVAKRETGETVAFTGRIEAENESRLAFRVGGRMIERLANVGDRVEPDQVVARLDPQDQLNSLHAAQAAVAASQAQLAEAKSEFERQRFLLARNVNSRAQFERAEQAMKTARAQLETAHAQSRLAEDQVARTELRSDAAGVVTAAPVEAGEVVQAGQPIIRVARKDGRDAVFDVPGQVLLSRPKFGENFDNYINKSAHRFSPVFVGARSLMRYKTPASRSASTKLNPPNAAFCSRECL
jgi:membrane fusion protein, multidrug efflux system